MVADTMVVGMVAMAITAGMGIPLSRTLVNISILGMSPSHRPHTTGAHRMAVAMPIKPIPVAK